MSSTKRRIGFSGFGMGAIATVVQVTVGACGSHSTSGPGSPSNHHAKYTGNGNSNER